MLSTIGVPDTAHNSALVDRKLTPFTIGFTEADDALEPFGLMAFTFGAGQEALKSHGRHVGGRFAGIARSTER